MIGVRGTSFVDAWTLVHLAFWFVVGANLASFDTPVWVCWLVFTGVALLWEVVEQLVVHRLLGWVRHPESWWNSWVSDVLAAWIGGFAGYYIIGTGGL